METRCPFKRIFRSNPIGNLLAFQKDPYAFFEEQKPKDTTMPVKLNLGFRRFYFCYDPGHAQHILQDQKDRYEKSSLVLKKIKSLSGPRGLIQLRGEEATRVRQTSGKLMNPIGMDRLVQKIGSFVNELSPLIEQSIERQEPLDLVPHLTRIVLRTAGVFVLNHDLLSESDQLNQAFVDLNRRAGESLRSLGGCPFSPARTRSLKTIHAELDQISEKTLGETGPSLLKALTANGEEKAFIRDQLKAFLFAGYDTTASSLIFSTYLVAAHKSVQCKIAAESEAVGELSYGNVKKLAYIQASYKEALRLYPSAYFLPREAAQEDQLGGVKIAKGSQVFLSVRHIQRHPGYFKNPNDFIPERFLKELKHPFSFIPFGGGPRVCIGAALAKLEATVVLHQLCSRYEMRPVSSMPPQIEALITAHTKSPLLIHFSRRKKVPYES